MNKSQVKLIKRMYRTYRSVGNAVVVGVVVARVANSVAIRVFLAGVRRIHAVVLKNQTKNTSNEKSKK